MGSNEVWLNFMEHYGNEICQRKVMELEGFYKSHRDDFIPEFLESFRQICSEIKRMQLCNKKDKIGYITYSMLRTAISDKNPIYLIEATNKERFLDDVECWGEYDPGWAFRFLYELEIELEEKRKPYFGRISSSDIERLKLQEATKYHQYVICFLRYAMPQAMLLPEFQEIDKEMELQIIVGEYLEEGEAVFMEDRQTKDPKLIKALFEEGKAMVYEVEVFTDLDLSQGNYWGINLPYADLRGSDLSNSLMKHSMLTGAKFSRASLEGTDLSEASIYEADFSGCNLKKANLYRAEGAAKFSNDEEWEAPGYFGVNFQGANLEGANFKDANLKGANFLGANLNGVNFDGTNLEKAVFSKENMELLNLNEMQRESIVWK